MSDVRFNETFDRLCKNSQEIMEAALNKIKFKGNIAICMGIYAHPDMTDQDGRNRDPEYFYYWEGDEPTDDTKEKLQERCLDAVDECTESDYTDASSAMVLSFEDDYEYYVLALFSAETDGPIEESLIADTILGELNQLVEPIALSLSEEEEGDWDPSDAGHVRVYGGAYYGHLIASD